MALLEIENLQTQYTTTENGSRQSINAVDEVSFSVDRGESFGLVGESGSGKSTVAESIIDILPSNGSIAGGEIRFKGEDIATWDNSQLRTIRWNEIALVSQSAMDAFNPVYTVGEHFRETIRTHEGTVPKTEMNERIAEQFSKVGISEERIDDYPHQFSGGMKQRAMIALAMILDPDLIIADEPTTALDVITQDQILHHLEQLQERTQAAFLLITHDMSVVADLCDYTGVMYAGQLVETGSTRDVFNVPYHPYTMGLKNAFPTLTSDDQDLISIPGSPPHLIEIGDYCRFAERCPFATEECRQTDPPMESYGEDQRAKCLRIDELGVEYMRATAGEKESWRDRSEEGTASSD